MEKINWLNIFEGLNIEEEEKIELYKTTTLEQKENYFSKASFSLTIQYLRNFKKEIHLLSDGRKIEYINSLSISPPKVGNTESSLFNQTVFEAQQNYYEFINMYKEMLVNKAKVHDNLSIYDLTPEEFYNHSKNEFIKHKMFFSETQFQADQLERLELLAEKYRNGIKNNISVKISQNQFIKIKQYIQYFKNLKQPKKKKLKLENLPKIKITDDERIWLSEVWNYIRENGHTPDYKIVRIKTKEKTSQTFIPNHIDQKLIDSNKLAITLLGILTIEPNSNVLQDLNKIINHVKKELNEDINKTSFDLTQIAGMINLNPLYTRTIFTLVTMYGSFFSSAGSKSSDGHFGYETFQVHYPNVFDQYIYFTSIEELITKYYSDDLKRQKRLKMETEKISQEEQTLEYNQIEYYSQPIANMLFPLELLNNTRGYIENIGNQAVACYQHKLYDASLVMIRKLLESLIIECYEYHKIESKIKGKDGYYFYLNDLIDCLLKEDKWTVTRNSKQAFPKIKKISDASAHNRRFNAKKSDIDKVKDEIRIIIEELVHISEFDKRT